MRGFLKVDKEDERSKFVLASLYAWGCPFLISGFTTFVHFTESYFPEFMRPEFGLSFCYFNNGSAILIYLHAPCGILLMLNCFFFGMTVFNIRRLSKKSAILRSIDSKIHCENDHGRYSIYLKLFLVMGAGWSLGWVGEAISMTPFRLKSRLMYKFSYFVKLYVRLIGIFVSILFICNRRTWKIVRQHRNSRLDSSRRINFS